MTKTTTATIETLTAEVRVLAVGNRQITKSVYLQLDAVLPDSDFRPFGRVCSGSRREFPYELQRRTTPNVRCHTAELVGLDTYTGALVRTHFFYFECDHAFTGECGCGERIGTLHQPPSDVGNWLPHDRRTLDLVSLPLIVLAGLR